MLSLLRERDRETERERVCVSMCVTVNMFVEIAFAQLCWLSSTNQNSNYKGVIIAFSLLNTTNQSVQTRTDTVPAVLTSM